MLGSKVRLSQFIGCHGPFLLNLACGLWMNVFSLLSPKPQPIAPSKILIYSDPILKVPLKS